MLISDNPSVNTSGESGSLDLSGAFHKTLSLRRSVYAYLDTDVPRDIVNRALADAVLAPNHHRTAPWRFFVIPREARERLVAAYEAAARRVGRDVARAAQRAKDAPLNVVVACAPSTANPRVSLKEEEFAVAAAVQNFMLSLAAAGVGTLLTTGELAESDEVASLVGLEAPGARLMGLVNVGYRNTERPLAGRPVASMADVARWL